MRTAGATGLKNNDYFYSPYGQMLEMSYNNLVTPNTPTVGQPYNAYTYTNFSWVGKNQKFDESSFVLNPIQMGARVYIPGIGRFLQVDPQEGGVENNYVYPPDPVNEFDLDGNMAFGSALKNVTRVASIGSMIPGPIGMIASGVAMSGELAQGHWKQAAVASIGLVGVGAGVKLAMNAGKFDKVAALAWTAGSRKSGAANMAYHYAQHGAEMGYKSAAGYTLGAINTVVRSSYKHVLQSGSTARATTKYRVVLTYNKKISSYSKSTSKGWNRWTRR
ncbi:MAG: hypothetical protein H7Z18_11310 [Methylophilaceae bacterium]|nr:hypothetical protein [Methylophilaceae bacterium]